MKIGSTSGYRTTCIRHLIEIRLIYASWQSSSWLIHAESNDLRYRGGADVDGSCRPWTEVVFRGRKLHCGPWTEVVSHATPPHLVKVKINFDEAQKLTWKEITCFYGLKTIITWNHISELLKMQLESKSRNVHTYSRGPVAGSFQNTLWPRRRASASEAAILASGAFAFVFSLYKVLIALSLCLSSRALQHAVSTSIIAAKIV